MPPQWLLVAAVAELLDPLFQFFEYIIFLIMYKHLLFLSCFCTETAASYWNECNFVFIKSILQRQTIISDEWVGEKFLVFLFLEQFDKKHMMTCKLLSHMPNTF